MVRSFRHFLYQIKLSSNRRTSKKSFWPITSRPKIFKGIKWCFCLFVFLFRFCFLLLSKQYFFLVFMVLVVTLEPWGLSRFYQIVLKRLKKSYWIYVNIFHLPVEKPFLPEGSSPRWSFPAWCWSPPRPPWPGLAPPPSRPDPAQYTCPR